MRILFFTVLVFFSKFGVASVDPCPLAIEEDLYGVWEAIDFKQAYRVFRIEINEGEESVLSQGMPKGTYIPSFSSYLLSKKISNGNVELIFQSADERLIGVETITKDGLYTSKGISEIKGIARVCNYKDKSSGVMEVDLILEPDNPSPKIWKLSFYKIQYRTIGEDILEMEKRAQTAAESLKKKRANKQRNSDSGADAPPPVR